MGWPRLPALSGSSSSGSAAIRHAHYPAAGTINAAVQRSAGGDRSLRVLVHADEAQVVRRDPIRRLLSLDSLVEEGLQRVPPDRAANREAHEALDGRGLL